MALNQSYAIFEKNDHKSIQVVFQKGSPLIKEFNKHIDLMTEMGLIKKWMENSLGNANKCSTMAKMLQTHERKEVVLNLQVTSTFFFLVLFGLVTTGLIFGVEVLIKKNMRENNVKDAHGKLSSLIIVPKINCLISRGASDESSLDDSDQRIQRNNAWQ